MDEMTQLRDLRADAPTPDRARLSAGRQGLAEAAAKRSRRGALRTDWRLTAVGAAAAVTVAVLIGGQLSSGAGEGPNPSTSRAVVQTPPLDDAEALLRRVADAAAARPDPQPKPGEWIYEKELTDFPHADVPAKPWERWFPYGDGEWAEREGDDPSPHAMYERVAELPADPAELLKRLDEQAGDEPGDVRTPVERFETVAGLARGYPLPPEGAANLYRAMATLEGVTVVDHLVTYLDDRKAIAVYMEGMLGEQRHELLFDPHSLAPLGHRVVRNEDGASGANDPRLDEGRVVVNVLLLERAMVDREGERP